MSYSFEHTFEGRMGSNKRYAAHYDRLMDRRIAERVMREGGAPRTLSAQQLDLGRQPLTRLPVAEPVNAWVEYGDTAIEVEAELTAYTPAACAIRWRAYDDVTHRAWVWSGAVQSRPRGSVT